MTDEEIVLAIDDMLHVSNEIGLTVSDAIAVFTACVATAINADREDYGLVTAMKHLKTVEAGLRKMVLTDE